MTTPSPTVWYLALDGSARGPLSHDEAKQLFLDGRANASTLAWTPGSGDWQPAGGHPVWQAVLASLAPPPLPPLPDMVAKTMRPVVAPAVAEDAPNAPSVDDDPAVDAEMAHFAEELSRMGLSVEALKSMATRGAMLAERMRTTLRMTEGVARV